MVAHAHSVTLSVGQALTNVQFGNRLLQGEATGLSWQDTSRNGQRDAGEPGLAGRQIYVDANNNGVWDTNESMATTDALGAYRLTPIPTGQQRIREILPTNWGPTTPANSTFVKTFGTRSFLLDFEEFGAVSSAIALGVYEREGFVLATTNATSSHGVSTCLWSAIRLNWWLPMLTQGNI